MRRIFGWLLVTMMLVACQSPDHQALQPYATSTRAPRPLTIAWIPKALNNPVFEMGREGALRKAAELTASGPVPVKVLYVGPVAADAAEQVRVIEDVIARGVDAIAISCDDPTACVEPINKAVAAGIPVITWDSDSPDSRRLTYLGADNYQAGRIAADLLVRALKGKGQVALLTGVPGAYNLEERIRGFKDGLVKYPDVRIIATAVSNDDINLGVQVVEETMQAHPNLDGWFFVGLWPLFAERGSMPLWENAVRNRGMKVVAFDTLPVELEFLRDGYLSALIGQKYWGWGADSIQMLYDHLLYGRTFGQFTNPDVDIVTTSNVQAMLNAWKNNDFSRPLPDPFTPDPFK
ncbi:MAG: putative transporter substrate binding protein [Chloroflexi bacterium]|nr:putative transporter substrate binding protein [Chloroflexota bacterium]